MTYNEFIEQTDSKKIVVFEMDEGVIVEDNLWVKHSSRVWKMTYSWESGKSVNTTTYGDGTFGAGNYGLASATELPAQPRPQANIISSMALNTVHYTLLSSLSSVEAAPNSFFWDKVKQVLYVHYDGYLPDVNNSISLGLTTGWASDTVMFNNIMFEDKILSIPKIKVKRDNLFDAKVLTLGGNITLINEDGYFDHFNSRDVYGKKMRLKFGGEGLDYDDYAIIYTGYIEEFDLRGSKITIKVKDERKNLERRIPTNYLTSATYPDLSDVGAEIAIGYGVINRAPAVCLNEEATASTYNFKFVDTTEHNIESINQVYVGGIKVTHTNGSLTNGTFDLADSVYEPGEDVSVDFNGYTDGVNMIENALDVIEDLIEIYTGIIYTSDFYNTTDWDALKTTMPNIGLYVKNNKMLKSVIGDIAHTILGTFIIEGDGRFNMKVVDLTKEPVKTIRVHELISPPVQDNPTNEYISSARVGFSQAYTNNKYSYYANTDSETALVAKYTSYKQKDFHTLLTNETDAESFSNVAMALFGGVIPTYKIKTKIQNIDVELEDVVDVELYKFDEDTFGTIRAEVISKSVNYTKSEITFVVKWISNITSEIQLAKLIKWSKSASYNVGAVSSSGNRLWVATELNEDSKPEISPTFWDDFSKLYWQDFIPYIVGDLAVHSGELWTAENANTDSEPGVGTDWVRFYDISNEIHSPSFNTVNKTGILIPLYVYPGSIFTNTTYNGLIDLAKSNREVPIITVLNPGNGPGSVVDGNYTYAVRRLQGANITVIGYVSTDYAAVAIATVKLDIDKWVELYPEIQGIFFDEMTYANDQDDIDYYVELTNYVKGLGLEVTIANPGSPFSGEYSAQGAADIIIGWENSTYPTLTQCKEDWSGGAIDYNMNGRGALVHSQAVYNDAEVSQMMKYYGWVYVTEDLLSPNPWDALSSYMNDMAETARTNNKEITLTGDVTGSGTTSINVTVVDDSHNHIISNVDGLQTALDGKLATTGTAAKATKLETARTIDITGDITATAVAFDGTANIAISAAVNNDSHTHDTRYYTEAECNTNYVATPSGFTYARVFTSIPASPLPGDMVITGGSIVIYDGSGWDLV